MRRFTGPSGRPVRRFARVMQNVLHNYIVLFPSGNVNKFLIVLQQSQGAEKGPSPPALWACTSPPDKSPHRPENAKEGPEGSRAPCPASPTLKEL